MLRVGTGRVGGLYRTHILGSSTPSTPWVLPGSASRINMISAASSFGSAPWATTAVQDATFATKTTGPDGSLNTGLKLIESATNNNHSLYQQISKNTGIIQAHRIAVTAKAAERQRIIIGIANATAFGSSGATAIFDLAGVQVGVAPSSYGSGFSATNPTIKAVGGGWCLCTLDVTTPAATTMFPVVAIDQGTGAGAQNSAYAGDTTSGIFLWSINVLPPGAWNFASKTFTDDFNSLGSVDTVNSGSAGFNWYVGQAWPNSTNYTTLNGGAITDVWRNPPATPQAADFSVSSSKLTIATDRTTFGNTLCTLHPSGAGRKFNPGGMFECSMAFDPSLSTTTAITWPAFWSIDSRFLLGTASEYAELDFFEALRSTSTNGHVDNDFAFHDWTIAASNITDNSTDFTPVTLSNTDLAQHSYATLWLTAAQNDGTHGLVMRFFDGVFVPNTNLQYSAAAGSSPASIPANPSGVLSVADSSQMAVFLGSGVSWPAIIDFVNIWQ